MLNQQTIRDIYLFFWIFSGLIVLMLLTKLCAELFSSVVISFPITISTAVFIALLLERGARIFWRVE